MSVVLIYRKFTSVRRLKVNLPESEMIMRIKRSASVALLVAVSISYFGLSLSDSVSASTTLATVNSNSKTSDLIVTAANPQLDCRGSGEVQGIHPGWSSPNATKLTIIDMGKSTFGVFWCPASAPSGLGSISYTITESTRGGTCETTQTSCVMSGITKSTPLWIMATDATGSYVGLENAVQNDGVIGQCVQNSSACIAQEELVSTSFAGKYRKDHVTDCTFAAAANWEKIVFGAPINQKRLDAEFATTGGVGKGLTDDQVFAYWKSHGINGFHLNNASSLPVDPVTLEQTVNDPKIKAVIAQLSFSAGSTFAGELISSPSFHWVVIDGFTATGPLAVTWGKTYQMTWQQWNLEAMKMWKISAN